MSENFLQRNKAQKFHIVILYSHDCVKFSRVIFTLKVFTVYIFLRFSATYSVHNFQSIFIKLNIVILKTIFKIEDDSNRSDSSEMTGIPNLFKLDIITLLLVLFKLTFEYLSDEIIISI